LQEVDLKRQEEKLVEEQAQCLCYLSVELEEFCECMAGVEGEHGTEAMILSRSLMEVSNAPIDLGVLPIEDIPQCLMSTQ
jgi:hypothetical protein